MTFAAIVLAAGAGTRFGGGKLSAPLAGVPLIHHAIRAARAAPVAQVVVVASAGLDIGVWPGAPCVVRATIASEALSASLQTGLAALDEIDGAFVFLGDMPRVPHHIADQLAKALGDNYAAVPFHDGRAGHPVLLSARSFADVATITGDRGAGQLLKGRKDVARIDCDDPGILLDIDTRQDIERLRNPGN
jgi:molybdenum cofactor cytidylyltransferase